MGGFIFRLGVRLKDWGEQLHCAWLVRLGLKVREAALDNG
jgi:hypothetical protein